MHPNGLGLAAALSNMGMKVSGTKTLYYMQIDWTGRGGTKQTGLIQLQANKGNAAGLYDPKVAPPQKRFK